MTTNAAGRSREKRASTLFSEAEAFSSFSVDNIPRAKQFYAETLGLKVTETDEGLKLQTGGSTIFLYPKPNHTPASFTVLNFPVDDIEEAVADLRSLGVRLEHYDLPDLKTDEDGILRGPKPGPQIAWFKDPAGNILSVLQEE